MRTQACRRGPFFTFSAEGYFSYGLRRPRLPATGLGAAVTASSPPSNLAGRAGGRGGRDVGPAGSRPTRQATQALGGPRVSGAVLTSHLVYHRKRPFLDCGFSEDG